MMVSGISNELWVDYSLLDGDIVSQSTEFTLKPDPGVVERTGFRGVEGGAALRVGIVVIVLVTLEYRLMSECGY